MLRKLLMLCLSKLSQGYYLIFEPNIESLMDRCVSFGLKESSRKKVLYIALKYDYGDKSRGLSYEEYNFYYTLKNMGIVDVVRFDYYSICSKYGASTANLMLKNVILLESIDVLLCLLYKDYFNHDMLSELSEKYPVETILWVFDDDKRFDETKVLSQCFNKVVTTIHERYEQRRQRGENVFLAQFAANHYIYRNYNLKKKYDVVFIGQKFGNRGTYIDYLKQNDVDIHVYGLGWSGGRVSQSEMIEIFNQSKIVLNFSSSYANPELKYLKGRMFEIPACGAFLLTEVCEDLEEYFNIGENVDIFSSREELLGKINYYLENDDVRTSMASGGESLVRNNHTFEKYIRDVVFADSNV